MLKRIVCSSTLLLLLAISFHEARAQSDDKRFEVGGQISVLQIETRSVNPGFGTTISTNQDNVFGFGGRFDYNISTYFALEAELNLFPKNDDVKAGRKIQGLFGVKAGKRFDKVGVFAKARPGFIRYEKGDYAFTPGVACVLIFPPPLACMDPIARTNFAMDLGGVVEVYPSKRTIIRFDAGDTIARFPARNVAAPDPDFGPGVLFAIPVPAETKHQFQGSIGFGFRF
jgi:Outer membrane protein beta-barrel domain